MSKKRVPLVSSNPFCLPDIENAWQGKPPHKISCLGISSALILVISPNGLRLWFNSYVSDAFLSISDAKTQSAPYDLRE